MQEAKAGEETGESIEGVVGVLVEVEAPDRKGGDEEEAGEMNGRKVTFPTADV